MEEPRCDCEACDKGCTCDLTEEKCVCGKQATCDECFAAYSAHWNKIWGTEEAQRNITLLELHDQVNDQGKPLVVDNDHQITIDLDRAAELFSSSAINIREILHAAVSQHIQNVVSGRLAHTMIGVRRRYEV